MQNIVIVADLGHASPRWVGFSNSIASQGIKVHIFTPSMSQGQMNFLGVILHENIVLHQAAKFKMKYKSESHMSPLVRRLRSYSFSLKRRLTFSLRISSPPTENELIENWETEIEFSIREIQRTFMIDLIVSSSSPFYCHKLAFSLGEKFNIPWFADYRDLHALNHNLLTVDQHTLEAEKVLISSCAGVITTCESFALSIREMVNKPVYILRNGFESLESYNSDITPVKRNSIFYTGQIYPKSQNIHMFLDALCEHNSSSFEKIEFRIFGTSSNIIKQYFQLRNERVPSWIKLEKEVSRLTSRIKQHEAGLLLLMDWKDTGKGVPLTTKLYEYLSSGVPIMLITENEISETISIIELSHSGKVFRTKLELLSFLKIFASSKFELQQRNLEYIANFSYDAQVTKFIPWLDDILEDN